MITIDRERDIYRTEDGTEYPSVSAIVSPYERDFGDEAALAKGRAVHRACELIDGGGDGSGLDLWTLDPSLVGYVAAWEGFKEALQPHFFAIEEPMVSRKWGYAGTPDRLGRIGKDGQPTILDLKTGAAYYMYPVRLAAYANLALENRTEFRKLTHGVIVYLQNDGRFSLEQVTLYNPWEVFRATLAVYHWQKNGGKLWPQRRWL